MKCKITASVQRVENLRGRVRIEEQITASVPRLAGPIADGWYEGGVIGDVPDGCYRSGFVVDPVYERIISARPHTFVQFKYAAYAGVQVLWQDAAGTIPVQFYGDPIGRGDAIDGSGYYTIQATSTFRPLWTPTGARLDGVDDWLTFNSTDVGNFLHHAAPSAVFMGMEAHIPSHPGTLPVLWCTKQSTSSAYGDGILTCMNSSGFVQYTTAHRAAPYTPYRYNIGFTPPGRFVAATSHSGSALTFVVDGQKAAPFPSPVYPDTDAQHPLTIGRTPLAIGTPLHATIEYISVFDREPTKNELMEHL